VIAVNPRHIEMYESLLFFKRLTANVVENYDFVNGAPAVGASLDLKEVGEMMRKAYAGKADNRNLYHYFFETKLANIQVPHRRFFTTNDPVLTPDLIDYFFNQKTTVFAELSERKKTLLHMIYDLPEYRSVLPGLSEKGAAQQIRQHRRFSVKCPARLSNVTPHFEKQIDIEVSEVSRHGFRARIAQHIPINVWLNATVQLGPHEISRLSVQVVQETDVDDQRYCGFRVGETDLVWQKFVTALYEGHTQTDLDQATRFLS
jgi:hypothetical protein